jgi:hypothetical protein
MITLTPLPTKYSHGYLPKIALHTALGNEDKVNYFWTRQMNVYGPITATQWQWITQKVDSIKREWAQEEAEFKSHLG